MLRIVRRFGLRSPEEPLVPGMQVVDWRVINRKSGKETFVLAYKNFALHVVRRADRTLQDASLQSDSSSAMDAQFEEAYQSIVPANIYPRYNSQFALYCGERNNQPNVYIKKTQILDLIAARGMFAVLTPHASQITAHEASICERLSVHQNPYIAEYIGVQVSDKLEFHYQGTPIQVPIGHKCVVGLVFTRYDCTLHELVIRWKTFDVRQCLESIAAGIKFLHKMGIVHGDIRPHNIFVKRRASTQFAVGDFDCAHDTSSVLTFKVGDPRWTRRKVLGKDVAEERDDWYGFQKLKEWLLQQLGGKPANFEGIGRPC